jgi:hypothetical protein
MPICVTSRDHQVLPDLKDQGAALAEDLRRWFPSAAALRMRLLRLVQAGYVEVTHHEGRRIYALGPKGRQHLGIRSNWRTRPQEALRQVLWRRCNARLVAEGYRRVGPWHGGLVLYRKDPRTALAVQVFATRPSTRHVHKLTKETCPGLIREGAMLCLFGSHTLPPSRFETRFSSLLWWRPLPIQLTRGCK